MHVVVADHERYFTDIMVRSGLWRIQERAPGTRAHVGKSVNISAKNCQNQDVHFIDKCPLFCTINQNIYFSFTTSVKPLLKSFDIVAYIRTD